MVAGERRQVVPARVRRADGGRFEAQGVPEPDDPLKRHVRDDTARSLTLSIPRANITIDMATTTERSQRVRSLREGKGWSRQTLARKAGVSEATVARIELYGQDVKLSTWEAMADALGTPLTELVGEAA